MEEIPKRPDFVHHQNSKISSNIREIIFGVEDGMVSTLGAITGIAVGTYDHPTVLLAGFVVIAVESISMAVGTYLSNKSTDEINKRKLHEERIEIKQFPELERKELVDMYIEDGWPKKLATEMASIAAKNKSLILQEMAYRELGIIPHDIASPFRDGVFMFFSYIIGGTIPLLAYIFLTVQVAIPISITITLIGLFILGALTTKFTKLSWLKSGLHMFFLASLATLIGYLIGILAKILF